MFRPFCSSISSMKKYQVHITYWVLFTKADNAIHLYSLKHNFLSLFFSYFCTKYVSVFVMGAGESWMGHCHSF